MGIQHVTAHYGIQHIAQIVHPEGNPPTDYLLLIGSGYVHNLIAFRIQNGVATLSPEHASALDVREPLLSIQQAMCQDLPQLVALLEAPETHQHNLSVFRCMEGQVVEEFCEERGWPNTTHAGIIMHDNVYYPTAEQAAQKGFDDIHADLRFAFELQRKAKADLLEAQQHLTRFRQHWQRLLLQRPELETPARREAYEYIHRHGGWICFEQLLDGPGELTAQDFERLTGRWQGLMLLWEGDLLIPVRVTRTKSIFLAAQRIFNVCYGQSPLWLRIQFAQLPVMLPDGRLMPVFDLFALDEDINDDMVEAARAVVENAWKTHR